MWVPISSIDKVFDGWRRDLGIKKLALITIIWMAVVGCLQPQRAYQSMNFFFFLEYYVF